jgi:hypothetical protein
MSPGQRCDEIVRIIDDSLSVSADIPARGFEIREGGSTPGHKVRSTQPGVGIRRPAFRRSGQQRRVMIGGADIRDAAVRGTPSLIGDRSGVQQERGAPTSEVPHG